MAPDSPDLGRVRVQTARMLEIYALLKGQLEGGGLRLSPATREQLTQAIWTIAGNMRELQEYLAATREDTSPGAGAPSPDKDLTQAPQSEDDLEDLLEVVIKWVEEMEEGR